MFFAAKNLVTLSVEPCVPWEFVPTENITAQMRKSKQDRQDFYQTPTTQHQFYTGIEGVNPNQRVSREGNPPFRVHAFVADFDVVISDIRVREIIEDMPFPPTWVETSLGGHRRFVWILARSILTQEYGFTSAVQQAAIKWLQLHLAPALDEQAFLSPTRLYCNGCKWEKFGEPIGEKDIQAFFISVGQKHAFKGVAAGEEVIPLEIVEKAIKAKFPNFVWPGDFSVGSQGPSFWIPESVSPNSAIVKDGGMISFSAHSAKLFNKWSDIIDGDFGKNYLEDAIVAATLNVFWDRKAFWSCSAGSLHSYEARDMHEQMNLWKCNFNLSSKMDDNGKSQLELAKNHVFNYNRVSAAVPVVMRKSGPLILNGRRVLNIYDKKPILPAEGKEKEVWGRRFAWLGKMCDALFEPHYQLKHACAWFHFVYLRALAWEPQPSCYSYFLGGTGVGKTFWNREICGRALGGYVDAAKYLLEGEAFNSHLYHYPYWALDDDSPTTDSRATSKFQAALKKMVSNDQHISNEKFVVSGMTEWRGAIGITGNLDPTSLRIVGTLDNGVMDKTNIFRCVEKHKNFIFPSRKEQEEILIRELPYFLKWIVEMELTPDLERHARYELASFQEPTLLSQIQQGNPSNPFKEILLEALRRYFEQFKNAAEWRGSVRDLTALIMGDPVHVLLDRRLDGASINRYMEKLQKEGVLDCFSEEGQLKTRIWVIKRPEEMKR